MAETQNIAVNALPVEAPQKTDYLLGIGASEEFRATVEDFVEATDVVSDLANGMVGKNLLNNTLNSTTQNGATITVNSDGTITANGTLTATTRFDINAAFEFIGGVSYVLTGCPSGGGTSSYVINIESVGSDIGSGYTYTPSSTVTKRVSLYLYSGAVLSNLVFKPMIRKATIKDDTYVPYQRSISAVEEEISYHNSSGYLGKNLLKNTATSGTANGVTWTVNDDKSITFTGTASPQLVLSIGTVDIIEGEKYILSGCPAGGGSSTYQQYLVDQGQSDEYGSGREFTGNATATRTARIIIRNNQTVSNLTFYPMVRKSIIKDGSYVPYSISNVDLTQNFASELTEAQNSGWVRKNLLKNTTESATQNGITFTVNSDNTVVANGTNSGAAFARYIDTNATDWSGQSLVLSGCPAGGSASTYALRVYEGEAGNAKGYDTGSGLAFTGESNNRIGIFVAAGATLNNVTFKPMVRPATIEDGTYVPYVPSNSALNADLANTLSFDFSPFNVDFPSGSVTVASFLTWLNANVKEATHGMRKIIASNGVIVGIALISAVSGSYGAMTVISYYAIHGQYHLASGTWSVRS